MDREPRVIASRANARSAFAIASLVLGLLLGTAAGQEADEFAWEERLLAFQDDFRYDAPFERRLAAVEGLGTVDRLESAALLLMGLRAIQDSVEELALELGAVTKALEPLQKSVLHEEQWAEKDRLATERKAIGERMDRERELEDALRAALAKMRSPDAVEMIQSEGLEDASFLVRAASAHVLGEIGVASSLPGLRRAVSDEDPRVRSSAVDALGAFRDRASIPMLVDALNDELFPVRAAAVDALAQTGGKESIEALIARGHLEDGRLLGDINEALEKLTEQRFRDPRAWSDWWRKNKDEFEATEGIRLKPRPKPPVRDKDKPAITYHGITTTSSRVVFVLDISGSMNEAASTRYVDSAGTVEKADGRSKFDVARKELIRTLKGLDKTDYFNIIVFNENVQKWQEKLLPALPSNISLAIAYLNKLEAIGGTNTFDSLEAAFHLGGFGVQDRYYESKVDTVFLLTDGAPSEGRIVEPDAILAELDRMNELRKIKIHTIAIGHLVDREFLRKLAVNSGGVTIDRF